MIRRREPAGAGVRGDVHSQYFFFFQAEDGIRDYKVTGVQTCALPISLKGVSKTIELPFSLGGPIGDPWGNSRIAVQASTKINRKDYGVNYNQAMKNGTALVGNEVTINLTVEATKQK